MVNIPYIVDLPFSSSIWKVDSVENINDDSKIRVFSSIGIFGVKVLQKARYRDRF